MSTATPSKPAFEMPPMSAEHAATQKVADRLVELCSQGKNLDAIRELYADNARHVEAMEGPGCPRFTEGKKSILEKAEMFQKITTIHSASCGKPIVNGDQFVLPMSMDCTCSEGPMANIRMQMSETCLYTVRNGKITEGKFFYSCGG
jgi:hypothetical protein